MPPPPEVSAGTIEEDLRALDKKVKSGSANAADVARFNELVKNLQKQERKKPKKEFQRPRFRPSGSMYQQGIGMSVMSAAAEQTACAEFKNIYYDCRALPWDSTDGWTRQNEEGQVSVRPCAADDACASPSVLVVESRESPLFYRVEQDLVTERLASVSFRMRQTITERHPEPAGWLFGAAVVWLDDGVKSTAVAFAEDYVGERLVLVPVAGTFDPATGELNVTEVIVAYHDWSTWHEYRLAKDAQGMIELFVDADATPVLSHPYGALAMGTLGGPVVMFGHLIDGDNSKVTSEYDFLNYSVGMTNSGGCTSPDGKMRLLSLLNMTKLFDPTYENNDVTGRLEIAAVEGLASNSQGHKFYLRSTRDIRDDAGNLVRQVTDNAQIGPVGTGQNPSSIIADGLSSWDGADAQGARVADGVYNYTANFQVVRTDTKGKEKVLTSLQAGGGPVQLAPPFPVKPRVFKNRNVTKYYLSLDWVDPRDVGKFRKYSVGSCSVGADPILDVMYDLGGVAGGYPKIVTNDNTTWCTCRYPYGDCGWQCTTGSYVTVTPVTSGWVLILVRAKAANKGGTCSLERLVQGGQWTSWDGGDFTFGGDRVDWGWLNGEEIQNVSMSEGQDTFVIQAKPTTFEIALEPDGRPSWDDDSGIAYASRATMGFTQLAGSTFIGQKTWGNDGINHLYRNDVNHDTDGDGLGDGLEKALGTCWSTTATFTNGITCVQQDLSLLDSDKDGIRDDWEVVGCAECNPMTPGKEQYDQSRDLATDLNFPRYGSDPLRKDVFVEIDYMKAADHDHAPISRDLDAVVTVFDSARVRHPDNRIKSVALHFTAGQLGDTIGGGGDALEEIPELGAQELLDDISRYFEDPPRQPVIARINQNRVSAFVYAVWGHLVPDLVGQSMSKKNCEATASVVTTGYERLPYEYGSEGYRFRETRNAMHELGHNLGFLGDEFVLNYPSIMSYAYLNHEPQDPDLDVFHYLDYSYGLNPNVYNEFHIDENHEFELVGRVDWNGNGVLETDVRADIDTQCIRTAEPDCEYRFDSAYRCGADAHRCCVTLDTCLGIASPRQVEFDCLQQACDNSGEECIGVMNCGGGPSPTADLCETDGDCASGDNCALRHYCAIPRLFRDHDDWNNIEPIFNFKGCYVR